MQIQDYYKKIHEKAASLFEGTLGEPEQFAAAHASASELSALAGLLRDAEEQQMLRTVCSQLEASALCISYGLYHPGMATLRLCLELGLASVYFSSNKLAQREWLANGDLAWTEISSPEAGVLSRRFVRAFFSALADNSGEFLDRAKKTYGVLSEYVHGNSDTWTTSGLTLTNNPAVRALYKKELKETCEVLKFAICARHLQEFNQSEREELLEVLADLAHISALREACGGAKEIK